MDSAAKKCVLQRTIDNDEFFIISEDDLIDQIGQSFPKELCRLQNAYAVEQGPARTDSPNGNGNGTHRSPSVRLYGEDYDEVNRTLVGIIALRWIHDNDYDTFTNGQPHNVRLRRESFRWLQDLFSDNLQSHKDLFALIMSVIINDLGKDPNLEEDYYLQMQSEHRLTHRDLQGQNHDTILLEAAKAGMIPSLSALDEPERVELMLGLELGSELNAGQLAQAENVPVNLEGLLHMRGHEHAYELKFMEQILDMAGAQGHIYSDCARTLIEPVFQSFKTVHEVSRDIIGGNSNLRNAYDKVLIKRSNILSSIGFRRLSVSDREQRALLRLLTMGRTADIDQAELFQQAFHSLFPRDRKMLVDGLNIDGNENETAVLPYYMPAMLSETLENTKDLPARDREKALASLMRYLGKVLKYEKDTVDETTIGPLIQVLEGDEHVGFPDMAETSSPVPGVVIERNMMKARETISSEEFKKNPSILDGLGIPEGQVLQRRRTSQSVDSLGSGHPHFRTRGSG